MVTVSNLNSLHLPSVLLMLSLQAQITLKINLVVLWFWALGYMQSLEIGGNQRDICDTVNAMQLHHPSLCHQLWKQTSKCEAIKTLFLLFLRNRLTVSVMFP